MRVSHERGECRTRWASQRAHPRQRVARGPGIHVRVLAVAWIVASLIVPAAAPAPVRGADADPGHCVRSADPVARADELLDNRYLLDPFPIVRLPARLTWAEDPFHDSNWQFQFQTLRFTLDLLNAATATGTTAYSDRALFLLKDWMAKNPRSKPASRFAWNNHSTAWRAVVYACAAELTPMSDWLHDALVLHGRTLADPDFYVGHGNHALNQSIGLLEVGHVLGRDDWTALARDRINTLVKESVDSQGVTNEQAVGYQSYNYKQYRLAQRRLEELGLTPGDGFARVDLMPRFLAQATLPNHEAEMIGDTGGGTVGSVPDTWMEFVATEGASGPTPPLVAAYRAGYLFARSGWGTDRAFARRDVPVAPAGPGRAVPRTRRRHVAHGVLVGVAAARRSRQVHLHQGVVADVLHRAASPQRRDGRRRGFRFLACDEAPRPDHHVAPRRTCASRAGGSRASSTGGASRGPGSSTTSSSRIACCRAAATPTGSCGTSSSTRTSCSGRRPPGRAAIAATCSSPSSSASRGCASSAATTQPDPGLDLVPLPRQGGGARRPGGPQRLQRPVPHAHRPRGAAASRRGQRGSRLTPSGYRVTITIGGRSERVVAHGPDIYDLHDRWRLNRPGYTCGRPPERTAPAAPRSPIPCRKPNRSRIPTMTRGSSSRRRTRTTPRSSAAMTSRRARLLLGPDGRRRDAVRGRPVHDHGRDDGGQDPPAARTRSRSAPPSPGPRATSSSSASCRSCGSRPRCGGCRSGTGCG